MIFVSHAREDAAFALSQAKLHVARGEGVLIDPPLVQGDAFWRQRLARLLDGCDEMLAVESAAAAASPWVQQERKGFAGRRRNVTAPAAPAGGPIAGADATVDAVAARRLALAQQQQAWLDCVLGQPQPRAEFAGDRAWLANGRIELRRVAAARWLATTPLPNALYREFVAAMAGAVPPLPTWTEAEFAGAFGADGQPATAMTWFEAAACAHWFGGELPHEADRLAAATVVSVPRLVGGAPCAAEDCDADARGFRALAGNTWDWCAARWQADERGPLARRTIAGGSWLDGDAFRRAGARYRNAPIDRDCSVGLRLALAHPAVPCDPARERPAR